jgi:hypothetical protein
MSRAPVRLYDIEDCHAFVHQAINSSRILMSTDEREELHAEGMAIMVKLARDYKPHIEGHERNDSRFSGYASKFLRLKLDDAWHRMHPEHQLRTDREAGRRRWVYGERATSLHAVTEGENGAERHLPRALIVEHSDDDVVERLGVALDERWSRDRAVILAVGDLLSRGYAPGDVASELGLPLARIKQAMLDIADVADRLEAAA